MQPISHSITNSGLIPGGQNLGKERQTIFCTAVNPMLRNYQDVIELDLEPPRLASYKQKWKHLDTAYSVEIQLGQRKRLKFYQTKCTQVEYRSQFADEREAAGRTKKKRTQYMSVSRHKEFRCFDGGTRAKEQRISCECSNCVHHSEKVLTLSVQTRDWAIVTVLQNFR